MTVEKTLQEIESFNVLESESKHVIHFTNEQIVEKLVHLQLALNDDVSEALDLIHKLTDSCKNSAQIEPLKQIQSSLDNFDVEKAEEDLQRLIDDLRVQR